MSVAALVSQVRERLFNASDAVVDNWPVSNNLGLIFGILWTYGVFVIKVGPAWMRDRKPYDPKRTIMLYNVAQVVACLIMVIWVSLLK